MKPSILIARAVFPEVIARLSEHFNVESNQEDRIFSEAELIEKLRDKDGAFTTLSERITPALLAACPRLKAVCNMAVGYNNIDAAAATAAGVMVTNTPEVLNETTADFGWALLMAAARRVTESERWLREGKWDKWRYDSFLGVDLHGSTLGIIGMGRIGQAIARRSSGFDMRVIYHNRSRLAPEMEQRANHARYVGMEELLRNADHVVLVLPYSAQTHHTIAEAELALMKPSATLVNIARGGIVDDAALIAALRENRIGAAGLDVFENEPALNPGFLSLSNVVLTPHIASASGATRRAMANLAADNLIAALQGATPPNMVNPEVLRR
jgi:glyoxylate reductase